jgi:hypothetical protein
MHRRSWNGQTFGAERQQDSKVRVADESRNALNWSFYEHRHTATGAGGRLIVLYFPFVKRPLYTPFDVVRAEYQG